MQWRDAIAVLVGAGFLWLVGKSLFMESKRRSEIPLRGKFAAASEWLEENGYHIIRVRQRGEWIGYYGERAYKKSLIADFIVRQGARYYAVKLVSSRDRGVTGVKLRDQWFPVYVAFGVEGILHVDVESEKVHVVDFDVKSPRYVVWRKAVNRGLWFLSGAIVTLAWLHGR